jgi:hypothetical protein
MMKMLACLNLVIRAAVFVSLFSARWASAAPAPDDLAGGFAAPPPSARPWVYWFVMDGNLNREGITADFEAMKHVGLGGALFMEVDVGIPKGPVKFMSAPWRELFKHANAEAARLGLVMTMPASPGWTGSGGPWVKPEQSMQKLVASETNLAGPQHFTGLLPTPPTVAGFYREVAVLAFPTPPAPYRIPYVSEKALYHRGHFSSEAGVRLLFPPLAEYAVLNPDEVIPKERLLDLSGKLDGQGRLEWEVPPGQWTVLRFGHTSTGANTRPAPEPGVGLECDKLDRAALDAHFTNFLGKLMTDLGPLTGQSLVSLHIDSWEMGPQNWTGKFREEFQKRRGYDLLPYLPAMTGRVVGSLEVSERFLWDLRQTVLELIADNHAGHLAELAHQHGMGLSIEPYDGTPCDDMTYGARADVPMGEFWRDTFSTWFSCTEASSIAHTYGKRVVQAEAFTSGDGERWFAYPASLKTLGDWALCDGINRFVFHRYAHQPWLDRWPGMTMGPYGIHYERTQTWWEQSRAWIDYLSRCQFLLQQGLFVADVCFLKPEASPQVFRPPASATRGSPPGRTGYNFDGLNPEALLTRASVKDGRLVLPDGMTYRVLVLPETPTMTPTLLRKITELVAAGATVIGPPPRKSPSLSGYPQCDAEVKKLADELWGENAARVSSAAVGQGRGDEMTTTERRYGQGRVVWQRRSAPDLAQEARNPLTPAKWIWFQEGNPAASAPVGKRWFRRTLTLDDARVESARMFMTADNSFEIYVNGSPAGKDDNFHFVYAYEVGPLLKPGVNVLGVAAANGGETPNPAGLIGALVIKFADGHRLEVPTDRQWQAAQTIRDQWSSDTASSEGWSAALELGPLGMAPWGTIGQPVVQPETYCHFAIVSNVLATLGVSPDFASDAPLRYAHRRTDQADLYFVANPDEHPLDAICTFRVSGKAPELWDPVTGERRELGEFTSKDGRTSMPMRFEPAQSLFVVFRSPVARPKVAGPNFPVSTQVAELSGPWEVSFEPRWGGPAKITFATLEDWSKRPEDGIKYYSGRATYRKTFDLPATIQSDQAGKSGTRTLRLHLGVVKNLAQVRLNGRDLGVVWCDPWQVDATAALKARDNQLEITVVNLWPNRLIGDQFLPADKRLTRTTWNPFRKESLLLESGLLGPVTLRATPILATREP